MTRLHMVLLILMCIGANVLQSGAETLLATEGDLVTLQCSLNGTFTYPEWRGPPSLVIYTNQGSPLINPAVTASARLSYASNNQDLLLANAVVADSGEYKCTYAGLDDYTFNLNVSEKTSTGSTSAPTSAANTTGSTTSPPNVTDSDDKKIIIGVSVGVVIAVVLAILIGIICYFKYKNKERKQEHSENKVSYSNNQGQDVQHGRFSNKSYETENRL